MVLVERDRANQRLGEHRVRVAQIRAFRHEFSPEQLARITFITPYVLQNIMDTIDAHPEWDDEQVAESVDFE